MPNWQYTAPLLTEQNCLVYPSISGYVQTEELEKHRNPRMYDVLSPLLIVSDIRLYREGLAAILAEESIIKDIQTCSDQPSALAAIARQDFSAICVDCALLDASGLIGKLVDYRKTVILLGLDADAGSAVAWLEKGAAGYVCKDASLAELLRTLVSAVNKEVICSREIASALHLRICGNRPQRSASSLKLLTVREREIAKLLQRGWSNKHIARHLRISISTTKNHVHHILAKLSVRSRGEAAAILSNSRPRINMP